jgi:hypothetical protein
MLKKTLLTAAAIGLVAGAALPLSQVPANAGRHHAEAGPPPVGAIAGRKGCRQAAKAQYPGDRKARHQFHKMCIAEWKASKKGRGAPPA